MAVYLKIFLIKLHSNITNRTTNRRHGKTLYHQQLNKDSRGKCFTVKECHLWILLLENVWMIHQSIVLKIVWQFFG